MAKEPIRSVQSTGKPCKIACLGSEISLKPVLKPAKKPQKTEIKS